MDKYLKWMTYIGVIALLLIMLNANSFKAYGGGLPTQETYSNYEVKHITNTLYGIAGTTALNEWNWSRHVKKVWIIRKSSHSLFCDFDVDIPTFSYVIPTSTDSFLLDGEMASDFKGNIIEIPIECDSMAVFVDSDTAAGVQVVPTPNIRIIGIGD